MLKSNLDYYNYQTNKKKLTFLGAMSRIVKYSEGLNDKELEPEHKPNLLFALNENLKNA